MLLEFANVNFWLLVVGCLLGMSRRVLGIIGGSSFLKSKALAGFHRFTMKTEFGDVVLYRSLITSSPQLFGGVVFCQRHAANPEHEYSPPHLINQKAIVSAFKALVSLYSQHPHFHTSTLPHSHILPFPHTKQLRC